MRSYFINEIFYSLQGEGVKVGVPSIFVRFAGCNLKCSMRPGELSPGGFDCDTEFMGKVEMETDAILSMMHTVGGKCDRVVLTGGEPALQVSPDLVKAMHDDGFAEVAIETNGSIKLPAGLDWITVSPKVAEHCIRQTSASEVKYVRGFGQALPKTSVKADHYLISPAFDGLRIDKATVDWCIQLCKENPQWRLSPQFHKTWAIR